MFIIIWFLSRSWQSLAMVGAEAMPHLLIAVLLPFLDSWSLQTNRVVAVICRLRLSHSQNLSSALLKSTRRIQFHARHSSSSNISSIRPSSASFEPKLSSSRTRSQLSTPFKQILASTHCEVGSGNFVGHYV